MDNEKNEQGTLDEKEIEKEKIKKTIANEHLQGMARGAELERKQMRKFLKAIEDKELSEEEIEEMGKEIYGNSWEKSKDLISEIYGKIRQASKNHKKPEESENKEMTALQKEYQEALKKNKELQEQLKIQKENFLQELKIKEVVSALNFASKDMPQLSAPEIAIDYYIKERKFEMLPDGKIIPLYKSGEKAGEPVYGDMGRLELIEDFKKFCETHPSIKKILTVNIAIGKGAGFIQSGGSVLGGIGKINNYEDYKLKRKELFNKLNK